MWTSWRLRKSLYKGEGNTEKTHRDIDSTREFVKAPIHTLSVARAGRQEGKKKHGFFNKEKGTESIGRLPLFLAQGRCLGHLLQCFHQLGAVLVGFVRVVNNFLRVARGEGA